MDKNFHFCPVLLDISPAEPTIALLTDFIQKNVTMDESGYSCQQVTEITGLTRRQLTYWRKTGLIVPQQHTLGGHARYTFTDLIALKTAKRLIDAGVSVQRIRKSILSLTSFLPTCKAPLTELSLVVTGDMILALHRETAFEALTGQEWIYPVAELEREAARCRGIQEPTQSELFQEAIPGTAATPAAADDIPARSAAND